MYMSDDIQWLYAHLVGVGEDWLGGLFRLFHYFLTLGATHTIRGRYSVQKRRNGSCSKRYTYTDLSLYTYIYIYMEIMMLTRGGCRTWSPPAGFPRISSHTGGSSEASHQPHADSPRGYSMSLHTRVNRFACIH